MLFAAKFFILPSSGWESTKIDPTDECKEATFREFSDEQRFVKKQYHGHTAPVRINNEGNMFVHDFQLLPERAAIKGVDLDLYLNFVLSVQEPINVAVFIFDYAITGHLLGVDLDVCIRVENTMSFEADGETLTMNLC